MERDWEAESVGKCVRRRSARARIILRFQAGLYITASEDEAVLFLFFFLWR